jgi:hypothetical protein
VAVLVQAGGFGAESAAPIARDVIKAYYDKKQGKPVQPLVTQNTLSGKPQPANASPVIAEAQPVNKPAQTIAESVPGQISH